MFSEFVCPFVSRVRSELWALILIIFVTYLSNTLCIELRSSWCFLGWLGLIYLCLFVCLCYVFNQTQQQWRYHRAVPTHWAMLKCRKAIPPRLMMLLTAYKVSWSIKQLLLFYYNVVKFSIICKGLCIPLMNAECLWIYFFWRGGGGVVNQAILRHC